MHDDPRFIADASLSGLAKWLRLLGYATAVYRQEAGHDMMRQAEEDGFILLTRRQDMPTRQFSGRILLLTETDKLKQLIFVVKKLSLKVQPEQFFTICLSCNEPLYSLDRSQVYDLVPRYVYENINVYKKCPKCGKIYWPGTHSRNAIKCLKDMEIYK